MTMIKKKQRHFLIQLKVSQFKICWCCIGIVLLCAYYLIAQASLLQSVESQTNSERCGQPSSFRYELDEESSYYYPPPLPPNTSKDKSFRIAIEPSYGEHRCDQNAIFAFAFGYDLPMIIFFISTLLKTGYDGDLVIGVGSDMSKLTRSYLKYHASHRPGFVVYEIDMHCPSKALCQVKNLLEESDDDKSWKSVPDPRPVRRVAVSRFEYNWAWANRYSSESLLLLSDVRDVYFQADPMAEAVRQKLDSGTIFFFEEPSKIGLSDGNKEWLQNAYSPEFARAMQDKMIICSGTTLGTQPAIESYTRAMVNEFDSTNCTGKDCTAKHDQAFHNALIYQNRLVGANHNRISNVVIHPQGEGIVNTVGLLPIQSGKSLQELGLIRNIAGTPKIVQNDGKSLSAVIHMYDRDASMKEWANKQIDKEYTMALLHIYDTTTGM